MPLELESVTDELTEKCKADIAAAEKKARRIEELTHGEWFTVETLARLMKADVNNASGMLNNPTPFYLIEGTNSKIGNGYVLRVCFDKRMRMEFLNKDKARVTLQLTQLCEYEKIISGGDNTNNN